MVGDAAEQVSSEFLVENPVGSGGGEKGIDDAGSCTKTRATRREHADI
jgi:hypothetical protein